MKNINISVTFQNVYFLTYCQNLAQAMKLEPIETMFHRTNSRHILTSFF